MNWDLYIGLILATALLAAVPGPVVTLLVATGIRNGLRATLTTLAGSTSALALHVTIVGFGLSGLLALIGEWFTWIKWAGALYLIWLGIKSWRESYRPGVVAEPIQKHKALFTRGFIIGVTNPKTLLFYAAFFPLFIDPAYSTTTQLLLLCPTFVIVGGTIDLTYALLSARANHLIQSPAFKRLSDRFSGTALIAAGAGLASTQKI